MCVTILLDVKHVFTLVSLVCALQQQFVFIWNMNVNCWKSLLTTMCHVLPCGTGHFNGHSFIFIPKPQVCLYKLLNIQHPLPLDPAVNSYKEKLHTIHRRKWANKVTITCLSQIMDDSLLCFINADYQKSCQHFIYHYLLLLLYKRFISLCYKPVL